MPPQLQRLCEDGGGGRHHDRVGRQQLLLRRKHGVQSALADESRVEHLQYSIVDSSLGEQTYVLHRSLRM